MLTRQLGKDGAEVPVICFGAWPIGGGMGDVDERQAIATTHAAIDAGVTFIDTAESYRTSEEVLGRALVGRRGDVFLATKISGDHSAELASLYSMGVAAYIVRLGDDIGRALSFNALGPIAMQPGNRRSFTRPERWGA